MRAVGVQQACISSGLLGPATATEAHRLLVCSRESTHSPGDRVHLKSFPFALVAILPEAHAGLRCCGCFRQLLLQDVAQGVAQLLSSVAACCAWRVQLRSVGSVRCLWWCASSQMFGFASFFLCLRVPEDNHCIGWGVRPFLLAPCRTLRIGPASRVCYTMLHTCHCTDSAVCHRDSTNGWWP